MTRTSHAIALVDPSAYRAELVSDMLSQLHDQRPVHFRDADAALASLAEHPPRLVVAGSGEEADEVLEFTRRLRRLKAEPLRRVPVLLLAPLDCSIRWERSARDAGAHFCLAADFGPETLLAAAHRALHDKRPFIDSAGYVGPCRRVADGDAFRGRRQRQDDSPADAEPEVTIYQRMRQLDDLLHDPQKREGLAVRRIRSVLRDLVMRVRRDGTHQQDRIICLWASCAERHGARLSLADMAELIAAGTMVCDPLSDEGHKRVATAHLEMVLARIDRQMDMACLRPPVTAADANAAGHQGACAG